MGVLKLPAPLRMLAFFLNEIFGGLIPRLRWNATWTGFAGYPLSRTTRKADKLRRAPQLVVVSYAPDHNQAIKLVLTYLD
jgi:hypothetical protein